MPDFEKDFDKNGLADGHDDGHDGTIGDGEPSLDTAPLKSLAEQLAALSAENAEAAPGVVDATPLGHAEVDLQATLESDSLAGHAETHDDRISEMTAALQKLSEQGGLEEPHLQFIDGAAAEVDESTALDLILKSLPNSHGDSEANVDGAAEGLLHGELSLSEDDSGVVDESLSADELPANHMHVGEPEQLPIMGMEDAEEEANSEEPVEFVDNDKLISVIESLLFATDKPVSIATMKVLFKGSNIRTRDIQRALDGLASGYAAADRGVSLEEIHGGYQLRTKVDNTEFLKRLAKVRPFRLSGPALEVLAIAAYKQPITKTEVDQIRGVESGHLMRALMERGMVGFGEKSDLPGRPMTYVTTRKFLETFGLRNLKELPTLAEIDQLLPEGIGDEEEKETLSSVTDAMANQIGSSYSEGEDELMDISESLKVIDTTSEFFEQEKVRQRVERDLQKAQDIRDRITFGDEVEDKDRRWLARYEAKQEQIAQAAQAGEAAGPLTIEEEPAESVAGDLAALSSESAAHASNDEARDEEGEIDGAMSASSDDEETFDELAAKPDFEDDESTEHDV